MAEAQRLTVDALLKELRKVDPNARADVHRWGFSVIETSALDTPQVLITNSRAVRPA